MDITVIAHALPKAGAAGGVAALLDGNFTGFCYGHNREVYTGAKPFTEERWTDGNLIYVPTAYTPLENDAFYNGCNEVLWPLMHRFYEPVKPSRIDAFLDGYELQNATVAERVVRDKRAGINKTLMTSVHDYHYMAVAEQMKLRGDTDPIGFFLHIPFPDQSECAKVSSNVRRRTFGKMAWFDQLGFQAPEHRDNFSEFCINDLGVPRHAVSDNAITIDGRTIRLSVTPVGINSAKWQPYSGGPLDPDVQKIQAKLAGKDYALMVGRLDPMKSFAKAEEAFEEVLRMYPHAANKIALVCVCPDSRIELGQYIRNKDNLFKIRDRVNRTYGNNNIILINQNFNQEQLKQMAYHASVGACLSDQEGFGLVVPEMISAANPANPLAIIRSINVGAGNVIKHGPLVTDINDRAHCARTFMRGLAMPLEERQTRHAQMLEPVRSESSAKWALSVQSEIMATRSYNQIANDADFLGLPTGRPFARQDLVYAS